MQNDINKNKNIIKIADDNWSHFKVRSNSLLSKEFNFIMNYPGNLIPVVDNNELTGVINKNKIKNIPSSKLNQILVRQVKEDAPYIALETSCERTLKIEMQNKAIQNVFIIDRQFKFKGKYSVELVKSRQNSKSVYERLFNISLAEAKEKRSHSELGATFLISPRLKSH